MINERADPRTARAVRDRCLATAERIWTEGRDACWQVIEKCFDGCNLIPRWLSPLRQICKVNCAVQIGKFCYPMAAAAYIGYASSCQVSYLGASSACQTQYLEGPGWQYKILA